MREDELPDEIRQMCIDAHYLQLAWQSWLTIDEKYLDVQRIQYQVWELVMALIIKKYIWWKKGSSK